MFRQATDEPSGSRWVEFPSGRAFLRIHDASYMVQSLCYLKTIEAVVIAGDFELPAVLILVVRTGDLGMPPRQNDYMILTNLGNRTERFWSLLRPLRGAVTMNKLLLIFCLLASPCFGQAWSGVIAPARATNWTQAGLPGDVPPDASWTQAGATISPCGSSGSPVSPSTCGITS